MKGALMRKLILSSLVSISACLLCCCQSQKAAEPATTGGQTFTIREIMQSMVQPRADTLWNAVSTSVTDKGVETNAPKNEEEWAKMRYEAVTLAEAMNSILTPGRKVAKAGEQAKDPKVELSPDQIEKLINEDRESWTKLAHSLQDSVMVAIKAIDAKNAEALSNAGGDMDMACETCHKKYWYPNQEEQK
jgi:hypothetical protein